MVQGIKLKVECTHCPGVTKIYGVLLRHALRVGRHRKTLKVTDATHCSKWKTIGRHTHFGQQR